MGELENYKTSLNSMSMNKKAISAMVLAFAFLLLTNFYLSFDNTSQTDQKTAPLIASEEVKRVELYVSVMKRVFKGENGGAGFIAVDFDKLEGLSRKGQGMVLYELAELSPKVYRLSEIKGDVTKFEVDINGHLIRTINGTLLYVRVEEYKDNKAVLWGTSWFGNLGAYMLQFEATYENGSWTLKEIGMAMS